MSNTTFVRVVGLSCLTVALACGIALFVAGPAGLEYVVKVLSIAICIGGFAGGLLIFIGMAFHPKVKVYQKEQEEENPN